MDRGVRKWSTMAGTTSEDPRRAAARAAAGYRALGRTSADQFDLADGADLGRVSIVHGANADVIWFDAAGEEVVSLCHFSPSIDPRPVAGDWVAVSDDRIEMVLARRSALQRVNQRTHALQVLAANVDLVLLVIPIDRAPNIHMLERYAVMARDSGALPIIVLTKADESASVEVAVATANAAVPDVEVLTTSSRSGVGLEHLRHLLGPGVTAVMLGASGAGKTSLLNALEDRHEPTRELGRGGGRHATTTRKLYRLSSGGVLLDIPGIRLANLSVEPDHLDETFTEIDEAATQCHFRDCAHRADEGCAVLAAVAAGTIDPQRLANWQRIRDEASRLSRDRHPANRRAARLAPREDGSEGRT